MIKVLTIYGDSISTDRIADGGYIKYLPELLKPDVIYNHAVWGSGITRGIPDSLVEVLDDSDNLHTDSEVVLIWHGTNDWYWGSPMGDYDTSETFLGGLASCIKQIKASCTNAQIVFMTPLYRYGESTRDEVKGEADIMPNKAGCTMQDYRKAIMRAADDFGCKVIDMYTLSGFDASNYNTYLFDGIHPNEKGCEVIAQIVVRELNLIAKER